MAVSQTDNKENITVKNNLVDCYSLFFAKFYPEIQKSINKFFQKNYNLRFMGVAVDENILFYGDEYFVNKIPVIKNGDFIIKISANLISYLLDSAIGPSEREFNLSRLTNIEAAIIKSYTVYLFKQVESKFNKSEITKKQLQNSKTYSLTFYVQDENKHIGKIIISFPDFLMGKISPKPIQEKFTIDDFRNSEIKVKVSAGKSKIALNEIKALEDGDLIILEESNINYMSVIYDENEYNFKINPNPDLIVSVNNNGGNEMEEETSTKSQNMWDSILVDIVAEFDNVKMSLGELKQISEGLVIDVGSIYENKIKLRVDNQVVATGELVILNDRYGVRIENVKKTKEDSHTSDQKSQEQAPEPAKTDVKPTGTAKPQNQRQNVKQTPQPKEGDENFDYSDFEIEDESI